MGRPGVKGKTMAFIKAHRKQLLLAGPLAVALTDRKSTRLNSSHRR